MSFPLNQYTGKLCENCANLYLMCFATAVLLRVNNLASGTDLNAGWAGGRGRGRGPPWRADCTATRRYSGTSFVTLSSWEHRKYFRLHKKIFHLTRMTAGPGRGGVSMTTDTRCSGSETPTLTAGRGRAGGVSAARRPRPRASDNLRHSSGGSNIPRYIWPSWTICLALAAQILITKACSEGLLQKSSLMNRSLISKQQPICEGFNYTSIPNYFS